jgi:PPK2 family polyphosphate:nucleotide phosphotransferase
MVKNKLYFEIKDHVRRNTMAYQRIDELLDVLVAPPGKKINLRKDYDPGFTGKWIDKDEAKEALEEGVQRLAELQDKLYAQDNYAVLMILQALDAAGKDGTIRHVMSGINPQGVTVSSFKAPSSEELDHDYLWRNFIALPRRGNIGIFNRSYYEEMLVVRVHPEFLAAQKLPPRLKNKDIWKRRFEEVNYFEKYLVDNGILVVKFFLNVSKEAQKERFLERTMLPEKNWKFSAADLKERERFEDYIDAYEDLINHTSTQWAPWYIVPADNKWFTRLAVAAVLYRTLDSLSLAYPTVNEEQKQALLQAKEELENEGSGKQDWAVQKAEAKAAKELGEEDATERVATEDEGGTTSPKKVKKGRKNKKKM